MISFVKKIALGSVLVFSLFVGAQTAEALVLATPYSLGSVFSSSINGSTGIVTVTGTVTALSGNQPENADVYFKTRVSGTGVWTEQPLINISPNGNFSQTISGFQCGENYDFYLYQAPPETLIRYSYNNSVNDGFQHNISCDQVQSGPGEIMAPLSAGAQVIAGVNWGSITSTDTTVTFNGAYLIPIEPAPAQIFYQIEYGYGLEGQANSTYQFIGDTGTLSTNQPNYGFNRTISGLAPNTNYYFTIVEVVNGVETNLFTYAFAPTNLLAGNTVYHQFETPTSMKVSGHLQNASNTVIHNLPIEIVIRDMQGNELMAAETVTGPQAAFGSGYFEHLFFGMTSAGLTAGGQYNYVIVNQATGNDLTLPRTFTMPTPSAGGGGNTNTNPVPEYDGLVACGMNPNMEYDCNFNTFLETVNRVVNFLLLFVAFPCVALVVAWAGILLLTSGGSPGARDKAKEMIGKVIKGLIVALLAWVIIKLVLVVFGYTPEGPLWDILGTEPPE